MAATSACVFAIRSNRLILGSAGGPRKALSLAPGRRLLHHQRGHADQCRPARAVGESSSDRARSSRSPSRPTSGRRATAASSWTRPAGFTAWSPAARPSARIMSSACRSHTRRRSPLCRSTSLPKASAASIARSSRQNLGAVRAFLCAADFWDVGTPADYLGTLAIDWRTRAAAAAAHRFRPPIIDPTARVTDSIVWDTSKSAPARRSTAASSRDMVKIPAGVHFQNCAIIQREGELVVADIARRERCPAASGARAPRLKMDRRSPALTRDA